MTVCEVRLDDKLMEQLIALSVDWEQEGSCYGYRRNTVEDIEGNRVFLAREEAQIVGYLFGHMDKAERMSSICPDGTAYFEIEELYVRPERRSQGVGGALFRYVEDAVRAETDLILLGTATKNWRAILHFYIDELGMQFWSARLFKRLKED